MYEPIAVVYAPPGFADRIYCGINVPPALIETKPLTLNKRCCTAVASVANGMKLVAISTNGEKVPVNPVLNEPLPTTKHLSYNQSS